MASFSLEDEVCRMDAYEIFPDNLTYEVSSRLYTPEGEIPFAEGKTFAYGRHNFPAYTIFVPKQSVPEAERYEDRALPLLYSVILENGS